MSRGARSITPSGGIVENRLPRTARSGGPATRPGESPTRSHHVVMCGHHTPSYGRRHRRRTLPARWEMEPDMTVTTRNLTQAAGIAAAVAGAIFITVQINHPATNAFLTDTNEWVIRCTAQ